MNESAFKEDVIFIVYDDVLKGISTELMKLLRSDGLKASYSEYIDIASLVGKSDAQLNFIAMKRYDYNILEVLKKKDFKADMTYASLLAQYPDLYSNAEPLMMVDVMNTLADQATTKKIYIYHPTDDKVVRDDIGKLMSSANKHKFVFVSGELNDVLKGISEKIALFMLNNVTTIRNIIECGKEMYADIIVADYGYNYKLDDNKQLILKMDDEDEIYKGKQFRLAMFNPYKRGSLA